MSIIQNFYDDMAPQYHKLFLDWQATLQEQAVILDRLFRDNGFDTTASILDCACGIGTQAIGLASMGYRVTGSDISRGELAEAGKRAAQNNADLRFRYADFRALSEVFAEPFDIVIAMDNALPHMLTAEDLAAAIGSIVGQTKAGGMVVASIRDYDALLESKPHYAPPYIHETENGQRVCFQTWAWEGECYRLIQYIVEDEAALQVRKFECRYRATRREELTKLLLDKGCTSVAWLFPEETGFYQPVVVAKK